MKGQLTHEQRTGFPLKIACQAENPVPSFVSGLSCESAGKLLFRDLHETAGDVTADCPGIARRHVAVIPVLRDLDAEFLGNFIFQLLKRGACLRYDERVAAPFVGRHVVHLLGRS